MNLNLDKIKEILSKKELIQIYFILFILLNIFDFLNYLPGDIDFFKKLLSWILIGYIFYEVSFTKIFIGIRLKGYDLMYILAFSLISLVKTLILYTREINNYNPINYPIFSPFLNLIAHANTQILLQGSFLFGIILIIIISVSLLINHKPEKESLVGSINFTEFMHFMKFEYLTLILISIFFGMIIYNFFMEWFALAVDSVILVLGLIFYLYKYIHEHTSSKLSSYLKKISGTGDEFYHNLIKTFSNKKTIFIGISFLLTLHLIVDTGVYLVPYAVGTQNTLYFNSLNTENRLHTPLFNFINPTKSQLYNDMTNNFFMDFIIIIIYLTTLFLAISIMILPFYIYYKNIQQSPVRINKTFGILFLTSLLFFIIIFLLPNIKNPISIGMPHTTAIMGVDIYTNSVMTNTQINNNQTIKELFLSLVIFLIIIIFLMLKYDNYQLFFEKTTYMIVLIFFISYITIFYLSTIHNEYNTLTHDIKSITSTNTYPQNTDNFSTAYVTYENPDMYKDLRAKIEINTQNLKMQIIPFSDINPKTRQNLKFHNDYLLIKIIYNNFSNNRFSFKNISNTYFEKDKIYNLNSKSIESKKTNIIYFLGKNYFNLENNRIKLNLDTKKLNSIINIKKNIKEKQSQIVGNSILKFNEYIRLIFISIFYLAGLIAFTIFYLKKNIFNKNPY